MKLLFGRIRVRGLAAVSGGSAADSVHATFLAFDRNGRPLPPSFVTRRLAGLRGLALLDRGAEHALADAAMRAVRGPRIDHDQRVPNEASVPEFTTQTRRLAQALTLALDGADVSVTFAVGEPDAPRRSRRRRVPPRGASAALSKR